MSEGTETRMIVVKFRAAADQQSLYSAGLFIFDAKRGTHAKLRVAASGSRHLIDINLTSNWRNFEGAVISGQVSDSSASFLAEDIKGTLQTLIDNPGTEFHAYLKSTSVTGELLADQLGPIIAKCMSAEIAVTEAHVEELSSDDAAMLTGATAIDGTGDDGDREIKRVNVYLAVKLEVSPIKGTRIKSLKIGAEVYATLLDVANYMRYFPSRTDENPVLPAVVVSLDLSNPKEAKILVKLDEGIYGKLLLHPDVMLRTSTTRDHGGHSGAIMVAMFLLGLFILGLGIWMLFAQMP